MYKSLTNFKNGIILRLLGIFLTVIFSSCYLYSQTSFENPNKTKGSDFNIYIGMGLGMISTPSFTNYLREEIPYTNTDTISSFTSAFEIFGGVEYLISKKLIVTFDYSYLIKTVNYQYTYFLYDYFYYLHQTNLEVLYLINKNNYLIKFGGGVGFTFASLENELSQTSTVNYSSTGLSYRGDFIFSPMLSDNFGMYLGLNIAGNVLGSLKNNNTVLINKSGEEVNLSNTRFGLRMGVLFTI